ncbi:cellulase-like family protein [Paenibacillus turpanensis]|uniref:cellulase-like family protein n=1 Tax=Paenibacillus turpanensis TaxID=2689078 RepID=UPI00140D85C2|nr:cellulase-like family protein [Paenibacillus turpanensis]
MAAVMDRLPRRLTITMWDFSWYTMTMPGEPYHDLEKCFQEAVERGYNTIRICAMPYLLFTADGPRQGPLAFSNLGQVGIRTRWYNCKGGAVLDGHQHLLKLFALAREYDCYLILSSWEYQQSPSFLKTSELFEELLAISPKERFMALARSMDQLLYDVKAAGLADRIAYVELHNEIEFGRLTQVALEAGITDGRSSRLIQYTKPYVEEALRYLQEQHEDLLVTGCYTLNEPYSKDYLPGNGQVAHFHMYINGVLGQLMQETGIRNPAIAFPNGLVRSLLREDAPPFEQYMLPTGEEWRLHENPVGLKLLYLHDWCDPVKWDLYLYEHYAFHKHAMLQKVEERFAEAADWAADHRLPIVIGEGYVGYTPLLAQFEEGPVGKAIAEYAIRMGMELGFWGMVLCSNCAPHHPFWADVSWQQRWNSYIKQV